LKGFFIELNFYFFQAASHHLRICAKAILANRGDALEGLTQDKKVLTE
jgi:hypothetical protein